MALFKKKKETGEECCCGNADPKSVVQAADAKSAGATVKILGSGCKKCNELEANTKAAMEQLGVDASIEHVTDFALIAAYGVMTTPALVIGESVVSAGKVLKKDEVIELLQKHAGQ